MSLAKLEEMIKSGKTYTYRNQKTIFNSYRNVHGNIEIEVEIDGEQKTFLKESESKLNLFLLNFTEVDQPAEHPDEDAESKTESHNTPAMIRKNTTEVPSIYLESKPHFDKLTKTLLEDIEKVRNNPAYVAQAKQVCNNVGTIVNITKLQLQLLKKD